MRSEEDLTLLARYVNPLLRQRQTELAILRNSRVNGTPDDYRSCVLALEQAIEELQTLAEKYSEKRE